MENSSLVDQAVDSWLQTQSISDRHNENEDSEVMEHDDTMNMVILVWTAIIMLTGSLGNILVISAVFLHRNLRKIENTFIVNLAVADTGVSLIVNTFSIVGIVTKADFFITRDWMCEIIAVICMTCCTCSMWNIAAIGFHRYVVICHWTKCRTIYNRRTVPVMLLIMWLISFLIDLPNIIGWGGHRFDWKTMVCTADMAIDYSYTIYFCCLGFGVPLCFIIYSYVRICYHAWKTSARLSKVAKEDGVLSRHTSTEMRLARSVFIIVIVFIMLWAPYSFIIIIDRDSVAHRNIYIFSALLAHTSSSVNCIIYAATNRNFRQGYLYFIGVILCRSEGSTALVAQRKIPSKKMINIEDHV